MDLAEKLLDALVKAHLSDDERKLLLLALAHFYLGATETQKNSVRIIVAKLGGDPSLL